jgi:hypothetical protein
MRTRRPTGADRRVAVDAGLVQRGAEAVAQVPVSSAPEEMLTRV